MHEAAFDAARDTPETANAIAGTGSEPAPVGNDTLTGEPAAAVRAASWRRTPRRGGRYELQPAVGEAVLEWVARGGDPAAGCPRVAVVVAHPDDEAIGAGAVLNGLRDAHIVHVTDGAPADEALAQARGFPTRDAYAAARRGEVIVALGLIGITPERIHGLGAVDGETSWQLVELSRRLATLLDELQPDVVMTHPYEGGHSDHDSTAFAVHMAAGILRRDGGHAPVVIELTSYHNFQGQRRHGDFLPFADTAVKTLVLGTRVRDLKRRMYRAFTSQRDVLRNLSVDLERFRAAPRYQFTGPPHAGVLDYERLCRRITGAEWRLQAATALHLLRSRRVFAARAKVLPATEPDAEGSAPVLQTLARRDDQQLVRQAGRRRLHAGWQVPHVADGDDLEAAIRLDEDLRDAGIDHRHLQPRLGGHTQRAGDQVADDVAVTHHHLPARLSVRRDEVALEDPVDAGRATSQ
jgi:N-acetylglucosamine malate deacetylase 2